MILSVSIYFSLITGANPCADRMREVLFLSVHRGNLVTSFHLNALVTWNTENYRITRILESGEAQLRSVDVVKPSVVLDLNKDHPIKETDRASIIVPYSALGGSPENYFRRHGFNSIPYINWSFGARRGRLSRADRIVVDFGCLSGGFKLVDVYDLHQDAQGFPWMSVRDWQGNLFLVYLHKAPI